MNGVSVQLSLSTLHNHLSRQQVLMCTQHHCLILVLEDSKWKETWLLVSQKMHPHEPRAYYRDKSKEKNKCWPINACIESRKTVLMNLFAGWRGGLIRRDLWT